MIEVAPKYKYLEYLNILKTPEKYSLDKIEEAKLFVKEWEDKNQNSYTPVTDEERDYLKKQYKNLY